MSDDLNNPTTAPTQAADAHEVEIKKSWRDTIKIHPAANLFPMMSDEELDALAADIKKMGRLTSQIIYCRDKKGRGLLLDGRNRLEAAERAGYKIQGWEESSIDAEKTDPYAFVVSTNIMRRHLTDEARRELIAKLLEASPGKSDRQIAKIVKRDHKTVAAVRKQAEDVGRVPHVDKRTDTRGRAQPAKKPAKPTKKPKPKAAPPASDPKVTVAVLNSAWQAILAAEKMYRAIYRDAEPSVRRTHEDWVRAQETPSIATMTALEMSTRNLTVSVTVSDFEMLEAWAKQEGFSLGEAIRQLVREYCKLPDDDIAASAAARKAGAAADEVLAGNDPGPIPAALARAPVEA
jgi:ParB-like chromosome segregation protein Spo0J